MGAANLEALKDFLQTYESAEVEAKADLVRFCRVSKCYNQGQRRITLCLAPECSEFRKALMGALVQAKYTRRQGRAPATFMDGGPNEEVRQEVVVEWWLRARGIDPTHPSWGPFKASARIAALAWTACNS